MRERVRRRMFPLFASVGLIVIGMYTTTWGPAMIGRKEWALPYDLWGTLIATTRLAHGNIGGLYAPPTGLISLPGAAVILLPGAAVISALGLSLAIPGPHNLHPPVWLVAGPYQIALCCVTLFAADALAEHLGVRFWKRGLLAAASAGILWSVSARWGHPEDAVAVGLLLYAVLAQARGRLRPGRLAGRRGGLRSAAGTARPAGDARAAAVAADGAVPGPRRASVGAAAGRDGDRQLARHLPVGDQPAQLPGHQPPDGVDLARPAHGQPQRRGRAVPAGHDRARLPVRAGDPAALADPAADAAGEAPGPEDAGPWPAALLTDVLWWVALTLALRSFFEPVMVSYYPWPPMAVALIPAATLSWPRLVAAGVLAGGLTAAAQGPSHAVWIWWVPLVAGLVVLLALSRPTRTRAPAPLLTPSEVRARDPETMRDRTGPADTAH